MPDHGHATGSLTTNHAIMIREFHDADGASWHALSVDEIVAHGKKGARLAFRAADDEAAPTFPASITFNSQEAADFALRTLGEKELRRRLTLARTESGATR